MIDLLKKLFLSTGVAFFSFAAIAGQYPDHAKSTRATITVHVVWMPNLKATNAFCSFLMDIPSKHPDNTIVVGCYDNSSQTIYTVEPVNFNDLFHLEILGHELWHALGASHP